LTVIGLLPDCSYGNTCHASTTSDYLVGAILLVVVFFLIWLANRKRKR
jgi:hypothetical protein